MGATLVPIAWLVFLAGPAADARALAAEPGAPADARASVTIGAPRVDGAEVQTDDGAPAVDPAKVGRFVTARRSVLAACWDMALRRDRSTHGGRFVLRFTIRSTGAIADPGLPGAASELATCVSNVVAGWRTPFRPAGDAVTEVPMTFVPGDPGPAAPTRPLRGPGEPEVGSSFVVLGTSGGAGAADADLGPARAEIERTVTGCYREGRARDAALRGVIVVAFRMEPDGIVQRVSVSRNDLGDEVARCVLDALEGRPTESRPSGTAFVTVPYTFDI